MFLTYELDKERFGEFVSKLRKEQGMTQKELAERLFVSDKAVSKWERGQSLP
ncbi:MAG: helix-turn-helix transcriptional regulator, partial [Oscillospiraceae bacterium]|nr:helix-turn-helix transcriptional regulator [Oscillospiraceae bacterium]